MDGRRGGTDAARAPDPLLQLRGCGIRIGGRCIWEGLDLDVRGGEFVAVIGPNGAGKTSLLRVLLGLVPLAAGTALVAGAPPRRGNPEIGYVPQQRAFDPDVALRGRDLVAMGLDGHRWGFSLAAAERRERVDAALEAVAGTTYGERPIGRLSGGEQQRLRIAQALVGEPRLLLCDEPLASLDLHHQRAVVHLVADLRRRRGLTVLFVTHDVNPLLPVADRVLCIARGRWAAGPPDEILTDRALSALYGSDVQVVRAGGQLLVVGADLGGHEHPAEEAEGR